MGRSGSDPLLDSPDYADVAPGSGPRSYMGPDGQWHGGGYDSTGAGWDPHGLGESLYSNDQGSLGGAAFRAAGRANEAIRQGGYAHPDDASGALSDQALEYIRQRGSSTAPGTAGAVGAALTSPYAAQRGPTGANVGQSLTRALTTTGQQQGQGAGNAMQIENQAQQERIGAIGDYGQGAAMRRRTGDQLAEFNATQQGDTTNRLYQTLYQSILGQQQRQQAQQGQDAQTGMQIGSTVLSLLPLLAAL